MSTTPQALLESARDGILAALAARGHSIHARVHVALAPGIPAVATTIPTEDGYAILVSPRALEMGSIAALIAHELAHVYRMDSKHSSHNDDAITAAYASLPASAMEREYQRAFVHHAINIVEDLYADGIAFRVMDDIGAFDEGGLGELLDAFLTDEPFEIADPREHRWDVTHDMVNNARTITLAKRHATPADATRAEATQARLLARIEPDIAAHATWFQDLFDSLPEETDDARFTATLIEYVHRFVAVAERRTTPA